MGTNLREPVPADPLKIPQFVPIDHATPAERAAQSATLVQEAGTSARQIGVPLTMHDFPRRPDEEQNQGEDTMHTSVPLFGLGAPRWRAAEGLPPHDMPGTASYDGVVAKPRGLKGLQGWDAERARRKQKRKPLWNMIEEGVDPYGIGRANGAAPSNAAGRTGLVDALDRKSVG